MTASDDSNNSSATNREEAVALTYNKGEGAPRVVAKGRGILAKEIIERAQEAGVYVHESPELVALLMQVDLDAHIPGQLYVAVAELLAWLYHIEKGGNTPPPIIKPHNNHRTDDNNIPVQQEP